jgi:hypothetical protein
MTFGSGGGLFSYMAFINVTETRFMGQIIADGYTGKVRQLRGHSAGGDDKPRNFRIMPAIPYPKDWVEIVRSNCHVMPKFCL